MSDEILGLVLLGLLFVVILGGFPISFTLIFLAMVFGYIGLGDRVFHLMTYQVFGTMMDTVLAAVAMFTFMGYVLESAGLMRRLFHAVQLLCGRMHGSLYFATISPRRLFAAATGIVGASVTIIALMAAPVMLKPVTTSALGRNDLRRRHARHPDPAERDAGGNGTGTPGLGRAALSGRCCRVCCSPGYTCSTPWHACGSTRSWDRRYPIEELDVPASVLFRELFFGLIPPAALILATLGSIVSGWATPTEGAAIGCVGALIVTAAHGRLTWAMFKDSVFRTVQTSSMVMILLAASTFMGAVFSALGTPTYIANTLVAWDISPGFLDLAILVAVLRPRLAARMGSDRRHHRADFLADHAADEG